MAPETDTQPLTEQEAARYARLCGGSLYKDRDGDFIVVMRDYQWHWIWDDTNQEYARQLTIPLLKQTFAELAGETPSTLSEFKVSQQQYTMRKVWL